MHNSRALRFAIVIGAVVLLLVQLIATAQMLSRTREVQEAAARETVERAGNGVEASINRAFVQVDAMLAALPAVLAPFARDGSLDVGVVNRLLQELNGQSFTYRDVLLVRLDGTPIAAALPLSRRRRLPLSLQTDFAQVAARAGTVSIGGPVKNPATGEWSLYFARNLTIPGFGPIMGVAEVPLPLVQSLLGVGGTREGLRVTLERNDGKLMASLPHDEMRIGRELPVRAADYAGPDRHLSIQPSRFNTGEVFALALPTLYPALSVVTTLQVDAALAGWSQDRDRAWLVSGVFAALMLMVAAALIVVLRVRERAEAERARARSTLENALESMSDGFVMFDANDRLIACNRRYREFYSVSAPFIVPGAFFDDILREGAKRGQYPQAGPDIESFVRISKEFHLGDRAPLERLLPDGRWVLITERRTPDGGTVGIRTDITQLKAAMNELAAARDAAAAAGEAKTAFLARMSHELRTPLNGVLGFAQVLLEDVRLAADQHEQIRILHSAGRHLLELVNSLLDFSKIEAGRMELELRPVPLRHLLEGCVNLLRTEAKRKALDLRTEFDIGLPQAVMADPTRLRQMLLNLLANAVKFTPSGGHVVLAARPVADGVLRFEVRDNGPGIAADQRQRLFQDFVQLAAMGDAGADGTGLGLAITARLATMMEGQLGCEDAPGGGALFWIELPLRLAEPPRPVVSATPLPRSARPLHLLVVDDIAANREVARALLRADGHSAEVAVDGITAIRMVAEGNFDAVLMDLQMPDMDGLEATRRIRALPGASGQVPVLAVTASALPEQIAACREAGMDGHLAKPIERRSLAQALSELRISALASAPIPSVAPAPMRTGELIDATVLARLTTELGDATAAEITLQFTSELAALVPLLDSAALDPSALRQVAHRMVGAARNLGASVLAEAALALEMAAKGGAAPAPLHGEVSLLLSQTLEALRRHPLLAGPAAAA